MCLEKWKENERSMENTSQSFHVCKYEFFKQRTGTMGRRKMKEIIEEKFMSWRKIMNFRLKEPI